MSLSSPSNPNTVQASTVALRARRCWLLPLALLALAMSAQAQDWSLVWSDEFDYTGLPDATKWGYEEGYVRNNEPQYYTRARPENASVANGFLTITARKEATPYNGATYTSASLTTAGKASWTYGRVEMRAKLPSGAGAWPAFWMLGTSGGWPQGGEIDIMEYQGVQAATIFGTVHWNNNGHQQQGATFNSSSPLPNEAFHIYAVEWFQDRMDFYYDNNKYFTYQLSNATVGTFNPFQHPQYLLVNYALGGWLSGVDYSVLPQQYVVDYVRVYTASTSTNPPPTVATAAAATPSVVTGTTTSLSTLGADDGGEPALTYTWTTTGTPPAAVTFSANGTNAAKNTTATFSKAGSYTLQATIRDGNAQSVTSSVPVTVNQTATATAVVAPASAAVIVNGSQQFTASARDQFGQALASQPTFAWTASGGGSIASSGLFTAGSTVGGPFTVTATGGGASGTASVTVVLTAPTDLTDAGTGTVTAQGDNAASGEDKLKAFDNQTGTKWLDFANANPSTRASWIQYQFAGSARNVVSSYTITSANDGPERDPANWALLGSNDNGATWTTLDTRTGESFASRFLKKTYAIGNTTGYNIYRLRIDQVSNPGAAVAVQLAEIEFIGTPGAPANAAPTVATSALANQNPVTGASTALSVLGADDAGEPALTYTWATTGTPPAAVTFSANGTNAAKSSTATFTKAGSYTIQATIRDAGGLTATSSVAVTVSQTLTAIAVAPANASVSTGASQQFTASASDQFGTALSSQPTMAWTVSGGGTIASSGLFTAGATAGGPFTVTAASGGKSGTASVSVTAVGAVVYHINSGGPAASPFIADQFFTGGGAYTSGTAVSTAGVANAAPAAVYQSERYGTSTYTLPGLSAGGAYTVRLHFAEIYWNAANQRLINVDINGTRVLASFDIWTAAGGMNIALVRDVAATASSGGQIAIAIAAAAGSPDQNAKISGIEILGTGPTNQAPTVATASAATPNPVTGATSALSVLGADDAGESALTYTWATTGAPPAAVAFSANGTNAAKATTATFSKAGSYMLQATIRDAGGLTATSSVAVTVNQTLTTIAVTPATASVATGGTQTFAATAKDQFAQALTSQPAFAWTVSGGGTVSSSGLFTAGSTAGGPFTVTAASGAKSGTASVSVSSGFAVKINFQPAASPTVSGYLVDGGLAFADRGNGFSYGWNTDISDATRDRNVLTDQLRDTFVHMQKPEHPNASWELAVPNGLYQVFLVSGDPSYIDSVFRVNVEGALAVSGTPTDAVHFFDSGTSFRVTVSDGRLTISNGAGALNNKIDYIEVVAVPGGGG